MWDLDDVRDAIAAEFGLEAGEVDIIHMKALDLPADHDFHGRTFLVEARELGRCLVIGGDDGSLWAVTPDYVEEQMHAAEWHAHNMRRILVMLGRLKPI